MGSKKRSVTIELSGKMTLTGRAVMVLADLINLQLKLIDKLVERGNLVKVVQVK